MKTAILVAITIIIASMLMLTYAPANTACSDYQIIGRTFDHCITDKRTDE